MNRKFLLITLSFLAILNIANAQHIRCGTMERDAKMRAAHPEMGTLDEFDHLLQEKMAQNLPQTQGTNVIYTIPVIVHVIHDGEAVGTGSNISQAQINSQLDVLNQDYSFTNPDTGNVPAAFRPVAANCEIHFCPAAVDPQGNILAEPGIDRVDRTSKGFTAPPYSSTNYIDATIKTNTSWDPTQYMNVWVLDLGGGLLGYAQFPSNSGLTGLGANGGPANEDGVVIGYPFYGSINIVNTPQLQQGAPYNLGRTATHEVGHWIGLRHINGDGNCQSDFVGDTPTQSALNYGCPAFPNVSCTNGPNGDMFMNYMDYVDDACMVMFSRGQKDRMVTVMTNATLRASLNTSTVCNFTPVAPNGNFASAAQGACSGTVTFQDQSTAGPTSWSWNFGDGSNSTVQNPTHTYTTNGTFTVTLYTSNAVGADPTPATSTVTINMPLPPTLASQNISVPSGQTATMSGTSSGTINWYDNSQVLVGTGTSFTTPPITANATYYAQTLISQPDASGGPVDNSIGNASVPGGQDHYLVFDVNQACTLKSVKVYAQGAGNRTIQHKNSAGTVITQLVVNVPDGMSVVNLNFPLTVGTGFRLGVDATQTVNLLRNNGGATFPYSVGSYADITGTDVTNQPTYYYYFYDWKIGVEPCLSTQVPVNITIQSTESVANSLSNGSLNLFPNPGEGVFKVVVENNQAAEMQIRVFNAVGQMVQASDVIKTDVLEQTMDLSTQAKGTYFVQIRVGDQVVYKKYMLQ